MDIRDVLNHNHSITSCWWSFKLSGFTSFLTFISRLWFVLCECYSRVETHIKSQSHHHLELFYFQDFLSGTTSLYFSSLTQNLVYTFWPWGSKAVDILSDNLPPKKSKLPTVCNSILALMSPLLFHSLTTPGRLPGYPWTDITSGRVMLVQLLKAEFLVSWETCFSQSYMIHWHISNFWASSFFYSKSPTSLQLLPPQDKSTPRPYFPDCRCKPQILLCPGSFSLT